MTRQNGSVRMITLTHLVWQFRLQNARARSFSRSANRSFMKAICMADRDGSVESNDIN